ncbi:palmitoyltransferase [Schizosaccharomyces japonicus yFS275]|uniref:Palmitoyltransferase n=1 Tax=Schizosaccharomyces japonicus (strain yFS275 / FY16936) TaxID=402676 RepID=B6K6V1_SCHJY|nr:palmitoyltransferase [Schizosaccharomyces japonicus yFS275]EEB09255.1 palmitoyltransferase [Schizosaccharomyces japonicus yFS275]
MTSSTLQPHPSRYAWKQNWSARAYKLTDPTYPLEVHEKQTGSSNAEVAQVPITGIVERRYKEFPGKTLFFCNGRIQMANQFKYLIITICCISIPSGLFFGFTAPWLWRNISPALPLTFAYILAIALSSMFKTCTSDPGIIPRNTHVLTYDPLHPWSTIPEDREVVIGSTRPDAAFLVTLRYCHTCHVYRPPRASHCSICDNCVEYSDHHCIWLNNCIGRRNYRYFYIFLLFIFLSAVYMSVLSFYMVFKSYNRSSGVSFSRYLRKPTVGMSFFLALCSCIGCTYPGLLAGYHCYLIARGQTTHEYLRAQSTDTRDPRPYNNSAIRNFVIVLCRPKIVSYIRPRRKSYI